MCLTIKTSRKKALEILNKTIKPEIAKKDIIVYKYIGWTLNVSPHIKYKLFFIVFNAAIFHPFIPIFTTSINSVYNYWD